MEEKQSGCCAVVRGCTGVSRESGRCPGLSIPIVRDPNSSHPREAPISSTSPLLQPWEGDFGQADLSQKAKLFFFFCMALCLPGYKKGGREPQKPPVRQAVMLLEAGVEVGRDVAGSRQKGVWRWNWKGKWILMRNVAEQ